ncbi:cytochrome P450 family protein [Streptomyces caatingaensis]|uniref:Cytochrome P450 n=1 Tax=Streptomyces caatingaensis TaxID=1678637 RepID=A0A0K9XAC6_9ACTN|nr:cytochrome P450 [Streptomyces caatingaensis]KNB50364.1 cytochrome P450 [Streptomyces caatingaensis]
MNAPFRLDATGSDLHGEIRELRARGPVVRVELPGGVPAWAVTRHDLLRYLLTDPRVAKDPAHWELLASGGVPEGWPLVNFVAPAGMITADGGDHRRLRALVSQAFTPRRIACMRPHTEATVRSLLDGLAGHPSAEPVDLRLHYAYPLAMRTIGTLLGVPPARHDEFRALSASLTSSATGPDEVVATRRRMLALLAGLVAEKRARPGEDITSDLIAAREDGDRLSEEELIGTLLLMLVAGHGTTLNLVTNAVRALLTHPAQLALAVSGERPWSAVTEEVLRWDSPVGHFPMRYATEDIPLGGEVIRRGDAILASYAAAGRDPSHYGPTADDFDLGRAPVRHLTFGHGAHFCVGAALARQEAEVALPSLFARFPHLSLATDPASLSPLPSFISNSVRTLPVLLGS